MTASATTLSILLSNKQIAYAEEHGAVIVNFDDKDKPAEIEILNASKFMGDLLSTIIKAKAGEKQLEITCLIKSPTEFFYGYASSTSATNLQVKKHSASR